MEQDVKYWIELAKYDLKTAEAMFKSRRYLYVLFTCQQAIEKILKAGVIKTSNRFPPRTHDLLKLARVGKIKLDNKQRELLARLSFYYIETRYPEELSKISKSINRRIAFDHLNETKEIFKWIEKKV